MIDKEATIKKFGYNPDDLKPNSNKKVCRICNNCKGIKDVPIRNCAEFCLRCSNIINKHNLGRRHSELTKQKISKANKGKLIGDKNPSKRIEVRNKISKIKTGVPRLDMMGEKNSNYTPKRHTFVEENQGKHFCKECGKPIPIKIWHYDDRIPNCCSYKCSGKFRRGKKNGNWKGGISFEPYCIKFTNKIKEKIREKYNRKCIICGKTEDKNSEKLCIHHVDYNKNQGCDSIRWELAPLCRECHSKTNNNRKYWEKYLKELINLG